VGTRLCWATSRRVPAAARHAIASQTDRVVRNLRARRPAPWTLRAADPGVLAPIQQVRSLSPPDSSQCCPPGRHSHPPLSGRETATTTIAHPEPSRVTVGVDTHGEVHVACVLDQLGRQLATRQAATTPAGYRALLAWAQSLGEVTAWASSGLAAMGPPWPSSGRPGSGGAGGQPARPASPPPAGQVGPGGCPGRGQGDAGRPGHCHPQDRQPPGGDGGLPAGARATAVKARSQAANAFRALVVTAPRPSSVSSYGTTHRPAGQHGGAAASGADPDGDGSDQAGPAPVGSAVSGPGSRARRGGRRAGPADRLGGAEAAPAVRGRPGDRRGAAGWR
jgi:hypothetical protein